MKCSTLLLGMLVCATPAGAADRSSPTATEAFDIYRTIVAIPTVQGRGEVPRMAAYLAERFKAGGFAEQDVQIVRTGDTAGLMVTYRGTGDKRPMLVLAHMDVVEAKREDWTREPFKLIEEDGYFFGRGASDNKFDVAQLAAAFIQLKREGFRPNRDVILLVTGDEEVGGFVNTVAMLKLVQPLRPEFALNSDSGGGILDGSGKPEAYVVQVAEKTYATYEVTVRNPGGHSSAPRKDNAIVELAGIVKNVADYTFPVMANDLTRDFFRRVGAELRGDIGEAMMKFAEDPKDERAAAVISAAPEFAGALRTTCVTTKIRGGHADNALPQSATATINCRIFPGVPIADVRGQLALAGKNTAAEWKVSDQSQESGFSPRNPAIDAALARAVHARFPGIPINHNMSSSGTDAPYFRGAGIPTYGVSSNFSKPGESFQHGLNERARVESFFGGLDHWPILIRELASSH